MAAGSPYAGKRALDLLGGLTALVVALPLMLCIAVAIRLEDGGPVFYRQDRLGLGGRAFSLLKFRSMVVGADRMEGGLRIRKEDRRITRVGRFLRRFSLDELPQLVHVVRGQMSLVGPRPALVRDLERYTERERRRLDVRPGLTGLAQVSGRASIPWRRRIEYDLEYIDRASLRLDLALLGRTALQLRRSRELYPTRDPWAPAPGKAQPGPEAEDRDE
jgi:lipopolysaccharide/colanic/teichoic acid biosynthesis glycosyltransferase